MEANLEKIKTNTVILLSGEVITKILYFGAFLILTRSLGPERYGAYSFALSFAMLFTILADLGLNVLLVQKMSRYRSIISSYLGNYTVIKIGLGLLTALIIPALYILWGDHVVPVIFVLFAGLTVVTEQLLNIPRVALQAIESMGAVASSRIIGRGLVFLGVLLLVLLEQGGVLLFLVSIVVANLITLGATLLLLRRRGISFDFSLDWAPLTRLLKQTPPFALFHVFTFIYFYISTVILGYYHPGEAVGYYQAGFQLFMALSFIAGMITTAFYPQLSALHDSVESLFRHKLRYLSFAGLSIVAILYFSAPFIVNLFLGDSFVPTISVFQILLLALPLLFLNYGFFSLFFSRNEPWLNAIAAASGAIVNVLLNLTLVPRYGAGGAALAALVTELFVLTTTVVAAYMRLKLRSHIKLCLISLLSLLIVIGLPSLVSSIVAIPWVITAAMSVVLAILLSFLFGIMRSQDFVIGSIFNFRKK